MSAGSSSPSPAIMPVPDIRLPVAPTPPDEDLSSRTMSPSVEDTEPDAQIIEALKSPKDRLYVLKLGQTMETLFREGKSSAQCQALTTYHRLLVHRCAQYYRLSLEPDAIPKVIVVHVTTHSRIPARRISELVPLESPTTTPTFTIMHRAIRSKNTSRAGSTDGNVSDEGGVDGMDGNSSKGGKRRTIAEREAAYNEARSRIFKDLEEKETEKEMQMSASSSTLSLASGTNGGSSVTSGDGDAASTAPTESEYSAPVAAKNSKHSRRNDRNDNSTVARSSTLRPSAQPFIGSPNGSRTNEFVYPSLYQPSNPPYDAETPEPPVLHDQSDDGMVPPPAPPGFPHPYPPYPIPHGYYPFYPGYGYPPPPPPPNSSVPSASPNDQYPPPFPPNQFAWPGPPPGQQPPHFHPQQQHPNQQHLSYPYPYPYPPVPNFHNSQPSLVDPRNGQPPNTGTQGALWNGAGNERGHSRGSGRDGVRRGQPSRAAWSYGPGVGMGGLPQHPPEGMGLRVLPMSPTPREQGRRRQNHSSSGGSSGARTPADETASTASSSAGSSSSRRTFTSTTSSTTHHPLPARPDWAVGLRPQAPHHNPHHLVNRRAPSQSAPPLPNLHSTDFPPLTLSPPEKRTPTVGGAWTNALSTTRSVHSHAPNHALVANTRLDEHDRGFERPPPKGTAELFNPRIAGRKNATVSEKERVERERAEKARGEAVASAILVDKTAALRIRDGEEKQEKDKTSKGGSVLLASAGGQHGEGNAVGD